MFELLDGFVDCRVSVGRCLRGMLRHYSGKVINTRIAFPSYFGRTCARALAGARSAATAAALLRRRGPPRTRTELGRRYRGRKSREAPALSALALAPKRRLWPRADVQSSA